WWSRWTIPLPERRARSACRSSSRLRQARWRGRHRSSGSIPARCWPNSAFRLSKSKRWWPRAPQWPPDIIRRGAELKKQDRGGGVMRRSVKFAAAGLALALAGFAQAQSWPTKAVVFLNPFPAGGGTDTFARPIAARLGQTLGEQAIIENQGGAGGTVGAANAARRAPDGYNWLFGAVHHTIAESLYTRLPYSLEKDFEPITIAAFVPNVVVVH